MPDFDDYSAPRLKASKVFRMKRYLTAVNRIKTKYPSLKHDSEQFKRAVNKLLR